MGTRGEKTRRENIRRGDMEAKPQTTRKHPSPWDADLNPNRMAGQNIGALSEELEQGHRTAFDLKEVHRALADDFSDDELKTIPVIPQGQRLQQGGIYIDLNDSKRKEFTAMGDMTAGARNLYLSKSEVPYMLWNRLIGAGVERLPSRKIGG